MNLHGRIVPLFDLAALFETQHLPREKRMLLVIGHGDDAAGIVIDGLPRRMVFQPENEIIPPALSAGRRDRRGRDLLQTGRTPGSNSITRNYSINS